MHSTARRFVFADEVPFEDVEASLLLAIWLIAAAMGPEAFDQVNALFGSILGRLVLIGYTWALLHHMLGGIRHLIWDTGRGLDIKTADFLCWTSIILSLALTAVICSR